MQPTNKNIELENSEELSLGDLLYKFLPYWPFFVLLLIIGLSTAWIYLRYKMPTYQTTATILIKDDQKNAGVDDMMGAFDMFGSKKNVENEVEVLQSKTLMQEVVRNLHLYGAITIAGRISSSDAYLKSPVVIEARDIDSLPNVKKINFTFSKAGQSVAIKNRSYPLYQWVLTPYGVLKFLPNKYYDPTKNGEDNNEKEANFYFSLSSVKNTANNILSRLMVSPSSKQSTVIDLSFVGEVPQRGEDILSELLNVYSHAAILDKNKLAANTLKFVEDRLKFVENDLDSVEGSLQSYKTRNKISDISSQGQIFLQSVAMNDQKIGDLNMQLAVLDQVQNYVTHKSGAEGILPATLGIADPVLIDLVQKLSDLELKYTQTKKIVPENNPAVIAIVDGIDKLKPGILENIINQRKNLVASRDELSGNNNRYSSMLKTIPEKERELLSISRQQSIKSNTYTFLLQKREETALSFASAVADSRIIDNAETSESPVSPKKRLIYLASILAALAFGIAIIYIKEMLTRTVQQRSDIERYTDIPFLGEVAYDRSRSPIIIAEGKRSFIAEQFRQLRTSLSYMGIDEAHKRILITSSISGEGKSFIAINLGISLALMGKKVVLIELDLRKPKLSEQFNISRNGGISNYLIGKMAVNDIIKSTGVENLFLIPSGPIPPNPSELISNERLGILLAHLETTFDYILMDTAPTNPVTDAFILSPLADVSLYVIRHDYTLKMFIQKLAQQYSKGSLKNPAIVYNGIKGKGIGKYGGYGYGYGYTEDEYESWWGKIFRR